MFIDNLATVLYVTLIVANVCLQEYRANFTVSLGVPSYTHDRS